MKILTFLTRNLPVNSSPPWIGAIEVPSFQGLDSKITATPEIQLL